MAYNNGRRKDFAPLMNVSGAIIVVNQRVKTRLSKLSIDDTALSSPS